MNLTKWWDNKGLEKKNPNKTKHTWFSIMYEQLIYLVRLVPKPIKPSKKTGNVITFTLKNYNKKCKKSYQLQLSLPYWLLFSPLFIRSKLVCILIYWLFIHLYCQQHFYKNCKQNILNQFLVVCTHFFFLQLRLTIHKLVCFIS